MSKTLTLELPDEIYEVMRDRASAAGQAPEATAKQWLVERVLNPVAPPAGAKRGIEEYFGAWASGDPNSADNERIDADLARAYANES